MKFIEIVEKWDGILYSIMNIVIRGRYLVLGRRARKTLDRNKRLKDKHKGKRCFIVLNGPSINNYNLKPLKDEIVFATNFFFRAPLCKEVNPQYYCWLDSKIFSTLEGMDIMDELFKTCPESQFLLNYKGISTVGYRDNVYYIYSKHIPNSFCVRNNIAGLASNFSTVAFFAIASAIYMGFKEIYILGLDFEPGGFTHFTSLGKGSECLKPNEKNEKNEVCGLHWGYVKAQLESYYLKELAKKNKCEIYNLNSNSCIRAFDYINYNDVINNR